MTQEERQIYLIEYLWNELYGEEPISSGTGIAIESVRNTRTDSTEATRNRYYKPLIIPSTIDEQRQLLRGLFNIRMPRNTSDAFIRIQNEYLQEETRQRGIVDYHDLKPVENGIYLWQGDITSLACDAIVNAANSKMLGCFSPNHMCIDNAIYTFAGIQLREECAELMYHQGQDEPTGQAKLTKAYNLPSSYVIHIVGPIVQGPLTRTHEKLLASCYRSCMELAMANQLTSIAFCCISTGGFMFPNERAAAIAIETVRKFRQDHHNLEVIFNVFKDQDLNIYRRLLG